MLARQQNAVGAFSYFLLNFLRITPARSFDIWRALQRCDQAQSFLYSWSHMCRSSGDTAQILHLLESHLRPTTFIGLLETCVEQDLLSRALVNDVQEAVLARTTATGAWMNEPP